MNHDGPDEHDLGLVHDLPALLNRRRALGRGQGFLPQMTWSAAW